MSGHNDEKTRRPERPISSPFILSLMEFETRPAGVNNLSLFKIDRPVRLLEHIVGLPQFLAHIVELFLELSHVDGA